MDTLNLKINGETITIDDIIELVTKRQNMNHLNRFKGLTTLLEVYEFREELNIIADAPKAPEGNGLDGLEERQAANFYAQRCDAIILNLERRGHFLPNIIVPEENKS